MHSNNSSIINAFDVHKKSILCSLLFIFVIYWLLSYGTWFWNKSKPSELEHPPTVPIFKHEKIRPKFRPHMLQKVSKSWTQEEKCPACFGFNMCEEINLELIMVDIPDNETMQSIKGVFFGMWESTYVAIKQLTSTGFKKYDKYVCEAAGMSKTCVVSEAIMHSGVIKEETLSLQGIRKAYNIHSRPESLSVALCMTEKLVRELKVTYEMEVSKDWELEDKERAMLYTSLVLNPEGVILKFLTGGTTVHGLSFPAYYGACGRVVIVEDAGSPLNEFLEDTFLKRADLAIQMLVMIDYFIHADSNWGVLFADFKFSNFAVSQSGQVKIVDAEDIAIIDLDFANPQLHTTSKKDVCNEECFLKFSKKLIASEGEDRLLQCGVLHHHMELMYALACNNILSDLTEHKGRSLFTKPGKEHQRPDGLLHNPPENLKKQLEENLLLCVEEKQPGQRLKAVDELKSILTEYTVS